jgi:hypothetical protein
MVCAEALLVGTSHLIVRSSESNTRWQVEEHVRAANVAVTVIVGHVPDAVSRYRSEPDWLGRPSRTELGRRAPGPFLQPLRTRPLTQENPGVCVRPSA